MTQGTKNSSHALASRRKTARRLVVIGAGIIGQAHALTARERGWEVDLIERDRQPRGASIRNFGTLWPIGCALGSERAQALRGVLRWKELARKIGFWYDDRGSLSLAYREEAWEVLREFFEILPERQGFELLGPTEIAGRYPCIQLQGLKGGMRSVSETGIASPEAMVSLLRFLEAEGVRIHTGTMAVRVEDDEVETADGRRFPFDQLLIAAGQEMRLFFPGELAAAQITPCRLQMMRTVPQPASFDLGAIVVSDLTLAHYPSFGPCASLEPLKRRLDAELPEHRRLGVHVIAAQRPDRSLILGDSHAYAEDFAPELLEEIDRLILDELSSFVTLADRRIAARWEGIYLKSTRGMTQVVLQPRERITMVTAMGGLGMTLGWGLAESLVERWSDTVNGPFDFSKDE